MSGSFDRGDGGRRPYVPVPPGHDYADPYGDEHGTGRPTSGRPAVGQSSGSQPHGGPPPITGRTQPPPTGAGSGQHDGQNGPTAGAGELHVPSRFEAPMREPGRTPIVPAGSVAGNSLTLVVSIMCFLACLTAGAVYLVNQSATAWLQDIASEVTVQVEPRERVDLDKTIRDVAAFLRSQPGVSSVQPLGLEASAALLEPWLGQTDALKALPVPRLIAVELDRSQPPDFAAIKAQLDRQFPSARLDDHRQWQQQIRSVTRSLALGGIAILLLVGAATTAIIVSATRSAMASNREIVEVLHYVGATDRFIAREFERQFLRLGIRAGLVGAITAMAVFFLMPMLTQILGGGSVTQAEMSRLIGTGHLDVLGYGVLIGVVAVIAGLCMLTSRFGVYRILHSQ